MKRKLCLLLCAAMTAAALAGCGGSGSAENDGQNTSQAAGSESQTSEGNVLIYAMDQEPETIDPTMNNYSRSSNVLQNLFSGLFRMEAGKTWGILLGVLLLFLLVPALSLSGLNASHIQERMDEFGVRKAFGAPRSSLFGQVFWENMLLMLPGGVAGLLFSYVIVAAYSTVLFSARYTSIDDGSVLLSAGMLLNGQVFLAAFMACLVLNLLSSMVPAWRAVRVNIVDALNSKTV